MASDDESAACLDNTVLQAGSDAELGLRAQHERRPLKRWNPDPAEHSKSRQCPCSSQAPTAPATVFVGNLTGVAAAVESRRDTLWARLCGQFVWQTV